VTREIAAGEHFKPQPIRWRTSVALVMLAWAPLLIGLSIVVIPGGMAGVRVSQTRGIRPGTLYPGIHLVTPLIESVDTFDMRDQLFVGRIRTPQPAGGRGGKPHPGYRRGRCRAHEERSVGTLRKSTAYQ
jgi:hypothetical protein